MSGYTKLFSSILDSTVWLETNPTRIVWITMLAKADQFGEVAASVPGLAHAACVTLEECQAALATFLAPDEHSRTKDFDGRRIEAIDGGWVLLNHAKYRDAMRSLSRAEYLREKQAESRARKARAAKASTNVDKNPVSTSVNQSQPISEASASSEAASEIHTNPSPAAPVDVAVTIYGCYPRKVGRAAALKAIRAALKVKPYAELFDAVQSYALAVATWPAPDRAQFVPHPATWFNRGSYDDDRTTWQRISSAAPMDARAETEAAARRAAF